MDGSFGYKVWLGAKVLTQYCVITLKHLYVTSYSTFGIIERYSCGCLRFISCYIIVSISPIVISFNGRSNCSFDSRLKANL